MNAADFHVDLAYQCWFQIAVPFIAADESKSPTAQAEAALGSG